MSLSYSIIFAQIPYNSNLLIKILAQNYLILSLNMWFSLRIQYLLIYYNLFIYSY